MAFLWLCSKWQTERNRNPEKTRAMQHSMVLTWTLPTMTCYCILLYNRKIWFFQHWRSNSPTSQSSPKLMSFHCSQQGFGWTLQDLLCPSNFLLKIQPFPLLKAPLPLEFCSSFSIWTLLYSLFFPQLNSG